ncbi:MAG: hypothetical protein GY772_29320 [bacterium]|nr:hypothetical protein [bacterium]
MGGEGRLGGLPFREATEHGVSFVTGKPALVRFVRNTQKAPNIGTTYQQHIEPHGRYLLHNPAPEREPPPGWVRGQELLEHPLVIALNTGTGGIYDDQSWKAHLQRHYGKGGKALSRALSKDGYDSVVTVDPDGYTREIVLVGRYA